MRDLREVRQEKQRSLIPINLRPRNYQCAGVREEGDTQNLWLCHRTAAVFGGRPCNRDDGESEGEGGIRG